MKLIGFLSIHGLDKLDHEEQNLYLGEQKANLLLFLPSSFFVFEVSCLLYPLINHRLPLLFG
jgi:hypothetical protein